MLYSRAQDRLSMIPDSDSADVGRGTRMSDTSHCLLGQLAVQCHTWVCKPRKLRQKKESQAMWLLLETQSSCLWTPDRLWRTV